MRYQDYPAIYVAADRVANSHQEKYLCAIAIQGVILVLIAAAGFVPVSGAAFVTVAGLFLLFILVAVFLMFARPDQVWYGARAVAESVKTMAWRYMCCAPPFSGSSTSAEHLFVERLRELLHSNSLVARKLQATGAVTPITSRMTTIRSLPLKDRVLFYQVHRINDQSAWYTRKSNASRRMGLWAYVILVAVCVAGLAAAAWKNYYADPSSGMALLGLITTIAAFLMTWIQAKRYLELSAAYTVSAHEISLLAPALRASRSQREFGEFVTEAENAFSREHTQWAARRDT